MKKILTILFFVIISTCIIYSQESKQENKVVSGMATTPTPTKRCDPTQKFPYVFCNNKGGLIVLCTSDPNNATKDLTPEQLADIARFHPTYKSFKPLKISMPICFEFDNSGPESMS